MSATSKQSPIPAFGAAHQAAAAAESAKRIDALRQRLEQYNAAIAQAMGMQGGASGGANDEEDDDDEYTDDTDEDEPRAGGGAGAAFDVEDYIRQFKQHAAASAADPGTASRPLFTDSYREESLPAGNAAVEPDSSEYTDTTEEEYEEVTDSEANYHSFEEEEEEDDDGGEPRLNSAVVPPWLRGAMFPNHQASASSPPKQAPVVDRCLNSELRQAAASVGGQQQATSPLDAANSLNDTVLTGTGVGGLAASQRINSPNPDEPSYSFRDLENAYHRITKIEQSVKKLSAFGMLEPRLPYADRVQQLREERVRLLQEESVLASESRELQSLVLPELAESDTNTHQDMQSLLQVCKSEKIYKAVHDRIKVIELKQTGLTEKVKRMQDTFSNLQRKKQLSTSSDTHNSNEATRLKDGLASLAKNKTEIDRLEKESSLRTEEVSGIQKKVDNWLAVLKDRDRNLDDRSAKMQHLGEQLQRRQEVLMSHKENRRL